jgi:hypothetical protein
MDVDVVAVGIGLDRSEDRAGRGNAARSLVGGARQRHDDVARSALSALVDVGEEKRRGDPWTCLVLGTRTSLSPAYGRKRSSVVENGASPCLLADLRSERGASSLVVSSASLGCGKSSQLLAPAG